jgi:hypothetical protein
MDSTTVVFACGYSGRVVGIPTSASLALAIELVKKSSPTGTGWQIYAPDPALTIAGGATTTLDLTTGLTSPLGESISGTPGKFIKVHGVFIEHAAASLATPAGITAFGGGSNEQQGVWAAGDKATLTPGRWVAWGMSATDAGITVDATHKNIALVNLEVALAATVNVFVLGKVA